MLERILNAREDDNLRGQFTRAGMREMTRAEKAKASGASMITKRAGVTSKWIETTAGETRKYDDGL